jgi:hypothetical protein
VKRNEIWGTCDTYGRNWLCVKVHVLVGIPEADRPLGGRRSAWKNNIRWGSVWTGVVVGDRQLGKES